MLTVYRASAGAGKTHKLTGEYLTLLFNPASSYRRILAVTFTNKATDEMKSRIIEELHNLSAGRPSDYIGNLSRIYALNEEQIRNRARKILITILHDYASFNISTIDRFFQQTIRAFTREIGLQGGYGIEMDQDLVLSEVVDNLLTGLEKPESKNLLGWLLRFADEKIESGGDWKLSRDIMALGKEIFKETYKQFSEQVNRDIADKETLENYKTDLYTIIHAVENEAQRLGEKGMALLDQFGVTPADFKGGSRSPLLYLEKLKAGEMKEPTATFRGLEDNLLACYTKTTPVATVQIIGCLFENGLNDCIKGITTLFGDLTDYYTAKEIVRYYYTLGILSDVSYQLSLYREEKNIMLIADTTELLNRVIDGSDTPFIYEKTGTGIDHYMIDEFQDTSDMQWENFRPLIKDSLDQYQPNLIVGDIKQSIYRFRNSDWKLLDEQVQKDFKPTQVEEETLKENWRSLRHIVEFNNAFFTITPLLLQALFNETVTTSSLTENEQAVYLNRLISAYDHSYQEIPPKFQSREGHVSVEFIDQEEEDWKEASMSRLPGIVEQLQDNGYQLKDIAILVRTNQEGATVADTLLKYKEEHPDKPYGYDIISDDALFIGSSLAIRFLVAILRHVKNPDDLTNEQMAWYAFATLTGNFGIPGERISFPEEIKRELQAISHQSLYEVTEGAYRIFSSYIPANEQVFIQAFLDMVSDYSKKEMADLGRFLKWWEESGYRKTIHTPDSQNAIRILTVHKSKGLGFKAVIIPFGEWELDHKPTKPVILWCKPNRKPFDLFHLVPIKYSQVLAKTIFADDYFNEKLHAYIDNLNTLYVAFTRAKEELIVLAPRPRKIKEGMPEKVGSISELLWAALLTDKEMTREGQPLTVLPSSFDTENGRFELGNWWKTDTSKKEKPVEEVTLSNLFSVSPDERLQLRLHGKGYFFDDPRRKHGALMHDILSLVETGRDIPGAVEQYRLSGVITAEESVLLQEQLCTLLALPEVSPWFNGTARVLNEVDILFNNGMSRRPDRILIEPGGRVTIIDYKFGEVMEKRYQKQVRNYMELIRQMGYKEVKGYLWYVELNEIIEAGN